MFSIEEDLAIRRRYHAMRWFRLETYIMPILSTYVVMITMLYATHRFFIHEQPPAGWTSGGGHINLTIFESVPWLHDFTISYLMFARGFGPLAEILWIVTAVPVAGLLFLYVVMVKLA